MGLLPKNTLSPIYYSARALVTQAALMFYTQLRFHFCHICKIVNLPAEAE